MKATMCLKVLIITRRNYEETAIALLALGLLCGCGSQEAKQQNKPDEVIEKRMKHNHSSWPIKGGNYLAKILAKKCSGRLGEVADKLRCSGFRSDVIEKLKEKAMSAATSPSKDGKGYEYAVQGHLAKQTITGVRLVSRA